jgi:hypothetical protein
MQGRWLPCCSRAWPAILRDCPTPSEPWTGYGRRLPPRPLSVEECHTIACGGIQAVAAHQATQQRHPKTQPAFQVLSFVHEPGGKWRPSHGRAPAVFRRRSFKDRKARTAPAWMRSTMRSAKILRSEWKSVMVIVPLSCCSLNGRNARRDVMKNRRRYAVP